MTEWLTGEMGGVTSHVIYSFCEVNKINLNLRTTTIPQCTYPSMPPLNYENSFQVDMLTHDGHAWLILDAKIAKSLKRIYAANCHCCYCVYIPEGHEEEECK